MSFTLPGGVSLNSFWNSGAPDSGPTIAYIAPTQSRNFDNSGSPDDHFICPSSSLLDNLTDDSFTLSYWLKPESLAGNNNSLNFSKLTTVGGFPTGWGLRTPQANNSFDALENGTVSNVDDTFVLLARTSTNVLDDQWVVDQWGHVILTFDISDKKFRIYNDAVEGIPYNIFSQNNGFSSDDSGQALIIGAHTTVPAILGVDGNMLHAALWTGVAADSTQRAAIYNGGTVHDVRLVDMGSGFNAGFWPFDNNFGVQDISENFLDGTFTGTTLVSDVP